MSCYNRCKRCTFTLYSENVRTKLDDRACKVRLDVTYGDDTSECGRFNRSKGE